jgi:hypothetical protein
MRIFYYPELRTEDLEVLHACKGLRIDKFHFLIGAVNW